jgi:chromosome segregation ATPase
MAKAVEQCEAGGLDSMRNMVNGWVSMESSEFTQEVLADEVCDLLHLDTLCNLVEEDNKEEDEEDEVLEPNEPATYDEIIELTTHLKKLSVQIGNWGEEYEAAAVHCDNACHIIHSVQRKMHSAKQKVKQTQARQPIMDAFLKK